MNKLNASIKSVTAFAPATTANVAVGFDILGFACDLLGDAVTLTVRDDKQIVIAAIDSPDALPLEVDRNTASVAVKTMCEELQLEYGFTLEIKKGIPLSSGLGGSAASAVAAVVACNAFLTNPLSRHDIVRYALLGEAVASGVVHADNVAPCVYGGLTLVRSLDPLDVIALPVPDVYCVLVHPHLYVNTKDARNILNADVPLVDHVRQSAQLASFIVALYNQDNELLKKSLTDYLIEPQRAQLVPAFYALQAMALEQGALGMSFSGSGPTLFAWMKSKQAADHLAQAMCERLQQENIQADSWVSKISVEGARVLKLG
jgi:homoserine kinase